MLLLLRETIVKEELFATADCSIRQQANPLLPVYLGSKEIGATVTHGAERIVCELHEAAEMFGVDVALFINVVEVIFFDQIREGAAPI